jgi:hypothetical protein
MLCENGCGNEANHVTKKMKNVCHKNSAKCRAINPKGKKKSSRKAAVLYDGSLLCEYCDIHPATHILVNQKRCCSSTAGNCKEVRKKTGVKISESRNKIDESTGLKNSELIAIKGAETKAKSIDEHGLNGHQRNGKIVADIKSSAIDENGLNAHQRNGLKYKEWLKTDDGKARLKEMSDELKRIQNQLVPELGITESKRRSQVMVETKINNINELGLNGFEQGHWKAKAGNNTGFIDGIFWQYSNERRFLERAKAGGIIDKVKRGPAIDYIFEGSIKKYLSDFIIENNVYEIKSRYTMFGTNNSHLKRNIAKLLATEKSGYNVFVVLDDETMPFKIFLGTVSHLL